MTWYRTGAGNGGGGADYVELTQSQYDQLSDAEKKNGKLYFITDANGDGSQFQPVIYSETEREIGVWLDGKPLYAKTFNKSVTCGSEQTTIDTNDIPNLDAIVYVEGYYASASINYYDSANYRSYTFAENSNHRLISFVNFGSTAAVNSRLTLYYTKTTDTAGSGTWTSQGVPAHHYSTTEQVVGTWVDGKTLYEKCFYVSNLAYTTENDFKEIGTISGVDNIISVSGILSNSANNKQRPLAYIDPVTGKYAILSFEFTADHGNANSLFFTSSDTWATANLKAIVQYTKSSS